MSQSELFDRTAIARKLGRLPVPVDDFVTDLIWTDLIERLDAVTRTFEKALLITPLSHQGRDRIETVSQSIAPTRFATLDGRDRTGEFDELPGDFDLVISLYDLAITNDVPAFLRTLGNRLRPDGLLVAAFLVNMVLGRLIKMERTQIGLLKAIGYSTRQIAWHYLKLALLIGVIGVAMGIAMGQWIGSSMIGMYRDYFRFPVILRDPATGVMVLAAVLGMATALAGGWRAVMASVRLPPAEAMSPPAPPNFSRGWVDRAVAALRVRQTTMMILRSVLRWPGRAASTRTGRPTSRR